MSDGMDGFNGLGLHLGNLARLSNAETRSISAENFTGAKGEGGKATEGTGAAAARELGRGWKVSPSINIAAKATVTLADITGPGAVQHIWLTVTPEAWRQLVLRIYWDDETIPSVEVPVGDFFANGWCERCTVTSLPIAVNPAGGFNSYWEMPFRQRACVTLENLSPDEVNGFYYQLDYTLTEVPEDRAYFHAQWRRSNPLPYETVHTLLDGVHPRFNEASNPDVHAFHEAFADIVALFQHFSYPIVLENQISKTRGNLQSESLLGQLAQQFGQATGRGAALRDALGQKNKTTGKHP